MSAAGGAGAGGSLSSVSSGLAGGSTVGGNVLTFFGPGTIISAFESLPLHERALVAAKVLRDVNDRANYGTVTAYTANRLEILAEDWEAKFKRDAKRDSDVDELARVLFAVRHPQARWEANPMAAEDLTRTARKLYDAGYRKSGDGQ